ncbi:MAG: hypothetical protein AAB893_04705, partial [Patescibacteria group bacterium]
MVNRFTNLAGVNAGGESLVNYSAKGYKRRVDTVAELLWFKDKTPRRTQDVFRELKPEEQQLPRPLQFLRNASQLPRKDRKALQNIQKFQQLLSREEDLMNLNLSLLEVRTMMEVLTKSKKELMILIGHSGKYEKRVFTENGQKTVIDNRKVIRQIDMLRAALAQYSVTHFSEREVRKIRKQFEMVDIKREGLLGKVWRRRGLYALVSGATSIGGAKVVHWGGSVLQEYGLLPTHGAAELKTHIDTLPLYKDSEAAFHIDPKNSGAAITEVYSRGNRLSAIDSLLKNRPQNSSFVEYGYNLTEADISGLQSTLRQNGVTLSDLLFILQLSQLSKDNKTVLELAIALNNTKTTDLKPFISFFTSGNHNPKAWMAQTVRDGHLEAYVRGVRPDLAQKLGIVYVPIESQLLAAKVPQDEIPRILGDNNGISQFMGISGEAVALIDASPVLFNFRAGVSPQSKLWTQGLVTQIDGMLEGKDQNPDLLTALNNPFFTSFLADSNKYVQNPQWPISPETLMGRLLTAFPEKKDVVMSAAKGNTRAFNELFAYVSSKQPSQIERFFESKEVDSLYVRILSQQLIVHNPEDSVRNGFKQNALLLGLVPVEAEYDPDKLAQLANQFKQEIMPQDALVYALKGEISLQEAIEIQFNKSAMYFVDSTTKEIVDQ